MGRQMPDIQKVRMEHHSERPPHRTSHQVPLILLTSRIALEIKVAMQKSVAASKEDFRDPPRERVFSEFSRSCKLHRYLVHFMPSFRPLGTLQGFAATNAAVFNHMPRHYELSSHHQH